MDSGPDLEKLFAPYNTVLRLLHESSESCLAVQRERVFYLNQAAARSLNSPRSGYLSSPPTLSELAPQSQVARYLEQLLKTDQRPARLLQWTPPVLTRGFPGHYDLFKMFAGELAENLSSRLAGSVQALDRVLGAGAPSEQVKTGLSELSADLKQIVSIFSAAPKETRLLSPARIVTNLARLLDRSLPSTVEISHHIGLDEKVQIDPRTPRLPHAWFTTVMLCLNAWKIPSGSIHLEAGLQGDAVVIAATLHPSTEGDDQLPYALFDMEGQFAEAGGFLTLKSVKGGYRLSTRFSALDSEPAPASMLVVANPDRDDPPPYGGQILLADDDAHIRTVVKFALTKAGFEVEAFADGANALRYYKRNGENLALSILDLVMPEMNGAACLEEIRKLDSKAKVILMSAYRGTPEVSDMIDSGNLYFLRKPFDLSELMTAVKFALQNEK